MNKWTAYAGALGLGAMVALAAPDAEAFLELYSGTTALMTSDGYKDLELDFKVEYDLGNLGDDVLWRYTYTVSPSKFDPAISHFTVELTAGFDGEIATPDWDNTEIGTFGPGGSNPGIPGNIFGIKFDDLDDDPQITEFVIETNHAPMWGDVYWKGGQDYAYNTGFGSAPEVDGFDKVEPTETEWSFILAGANEAEVTSRFLALWGGSAPGCNAGANCWALTPNSIVMTTPIPVPAALPIIGAALAGFGFAGWRTQRKAA